MGQHTLFIIILFFICSHAFAQERECEKNIVGTWQVYNTYEPFRRKIKKVDFKIWKIKRNVIKINAEKFVYVVKDNCSQLYFTDKGYGFEIKHLSNDTLILKRSILPHESYSIFLKKLF